MRYIFLYDILRSEKPKKEIEYHEKVTSIIIYCYYF